MSETPCPFCGQIHGTACNATGDATIPAVVPDAQRYDWREELDMATDYGMSLAAAARVAAYIERLEAEADRWRKIAEIVAEIAADLSDELIGAGAGSGEFIDEAVRRILIEQEKTK